jgi:hypothetical protein
LGVSEGAAPFGIGHAGKPARHHCPPFGQLAEGVNEVVGLPVVDWLTLAALACVLAGNVGLLATVGMVVRQLRDVA